MPKPKSSAKEYKESINTEKFKALTFLSMLRRMIRPPHALNKWKELSAPACKVFVTIWGFSTFFPKNQWDYSDYKQVTYVNRHILLMYTGLTKLKLNQSIDELLQLRLIKVSQYEIEGDFVDYYEIVYDPTKSEIDKGFI